MLKVYTRKCRKHMHKGTKYKVKEQNYGNGSITSKIFGAYST